MGFLLQLFSYSDNFICTIRKNHIDTSTATQEWEKKNILTNSKMRDEKKKVQNNNNNSNNNGTKNAHAIQNDILYAKYVLRLLLWLASYSFVVFFLWKEIRCAKRTNMPMFGTLFRRVYYALSICNFHLQSTQVKCLNWYDDGIRCARDTSLAYQCAPRAH